MVLLLTALAAALVLAVATVPRFLTRRLHPDGPLDRPDRRHLSARNTHGPDHLPDWTSDRRTIPRHP